MNSYIGYINLVLLTILFTILSKTASLENVHGGIFYNYKLVEGNVLLSLENRGPRLCLRDCLIRTGCEAIYFDSVHLTCHLLKEAIVCYDKWDTKHIFTEKQSWSMKQNQCWPNPCGEEQKCIIVKHNHHICVNFSSTPDYIPPRTSESTTTEVYTTETTTDIASNYTEVQSENTTFMEDTTHFTTVTENAAMVTPPEAIQYVKCRKKRKKRKKKKDLDITTVSNVTMTMNVTDNYGNLTDNNSSDITTVGSVTMTMNLTDSYGNLTENNSSVVESG